ncbi:MAG: tetratricopeptide repeat protein [Chloroflexi bacterium]|nr:tetratricopeptide repeat protein [Chloroflexota bacterium]
MAHLRLRLLANRPRIDLDEGPVLLARRDALHLLLYTADQGLESYNRDSLNALLFGEGSSSQKLREALHWLNRTLRDAGFAHTLFPSAGKDQHQRMLHFAREAVRVDAHEFSDGAEQLLAHPANSLDAAYESALLSLLEKYENHFLNGLTFDSYELGAWHEQRQQALADLRHQLLERLVQLHIHRGELALAKQVAELWRDSLNPGFVPLHYLIWLALTLGLNSAAQQYLVQLQRYQDEDPTFFGTDVETWRSLIDSEGLPSVLYLRLQTVSRVVSAPLLLDGAFSRKRQILDLVELLTDRYAPRAIGLTGLPGVGKSHFVAHVISLVRQVQPKIEIVLVHLTAQTDFETLLNEVLEQLHFQQFQALPYAARERRLRQNLRVGQYLIVIDDDTAQRLSNPEFVDKIRAIFENVELILVSRTLPGDQYYPVELVGFDVDCVRRHFLEELASSRPIDDADLDAVTRITGGLPLTVGWLVGFLRQRRFQMTQFVKTFSTQREVGWSQNTAVENINSLLTWIWYQLMPYERSILYVASMFDPAKGVDFEDMLAIAERAFPMKRERLEQKIARLVETRLLQPMLESESRWGLHPVTYEFVAGIAELSGAHFAEIRLAYIERFLRYTREHATDFPTLDREKENILKMFELIMREPTASTLLSEAITILNQAFDYFVSNGFYNRVGLLLEGALHVQGIHDHGRVDLLSHLGENALHQGEYDKAEQWYGEASELALQIGLVKDYADTLCELGRLHIMRGSLDVAKASLEAALDAIESHDELRIAAKIHANLAVVAYHLGKYDESEEILSQVTETLIARDDHVAETGVLSILQFVRRPPWLGRDCAEGP